MYDLTITGGTVVELDGDITYDGIPASAVIQFNLSGGKRLGRIAWDAGAPSASPIPIKKTTKASTQ